MAGGHSLIKKIKALRLEWTNRGIDEWSQINNGLSVSFWDMSLHKQ